MIDFSAFECLQYDAEHYNCMHFAADLYEHVTGLEVHEQVAELCTAKEKRKVDVRKLREFKRIDDPRTQKQPCIARMKPYHGEAHAGLYYQGRIMHLTRQGAKSEPVYMVADTYRLINYYQHKSQL